MALREALLALISSGPMTGYDVRKQFSASVGFVWHAPDSQIYPELRRMAREGLLATQDVPWGHKGAVKTQYSLTEAGEDALVRWQSEPMVYVRERDPARLKAAYFEWAPPGAAEEQLRAHIAHHEEVRLQSAQMIEQLERRVHPTLARRLEHYTEAQRRRIVAFRVFAYQGKVAHAEQEIAWARQGLALLEELGHVEPVRGGTGDE